MKSLYTLIFILGIATLACTVSSNLPVETVVPSAQSAPTPISTNSVKVTVTAWVLNIRNEQGNATGDYLHKGDEVRVEIKGNWAEIVSGQYDGMKIYRGCTSAAGDLGCESK